MTPERWKEIEAIFEACTSVQPSDRQAMLDRHCSADEEMRREVEELLAASERTDRLEGVVESSSGEILDRLGQLGAGDAVGPYRLERCLGEGGMGTVWLARRDDEEFEHRVAVKLVGAAGAAGAIVERFRTERQILAGLEHPYIARLLDGGTTEQGQPYLVMEYVDGEELIAFCDRRRFGIDRRLELFRHVCEAVEHAHRNLVVHRDLKPANILVHPDTGPKLLDFGIAKILRPETQPGGGAADLTQAQERLLTPDYASPEQVSGQPITTASDVYSLGVLLFELLTGRKPRRLHGLGPAALERALSEVPATRPSTAVRQAPATGEDTERLAALRGLRPAQLARGLRGDLDTIITKALHYDPRRRYRGVSELDDDLRRFLEGHPVLARPDSWRYRVGKLCRRHPLGIAAVTLIVALASAFVFSLIVQSARLTAERDRALAAESEAGAVSGFLLELFRVADPQESRGETVTARELLDRGSERIETQLGDEPQVRATLLSTLADVHLNLGLLKRAAELHRLALDQRLQALGEDHLDTAASMDRLGDTLRQLSHFELAEPHVRRGLAIRQAKLPADHPELADSLNNLGLLLTEQGRSEEAEVLLRRSLEIRLAQLGNDHQDTNVSRSNLGQVLDNQRQYGEAEVYLRQTLDSRLRTLGELHPQVANSMHVLATLYHRQGQMGEAEPLFQQAIAIRRAVLGPDHHHLALSLNNLAALLHDQLRLVEAEPLYREMLEIGRSGGETIQLAFGLNNFGSLLEDRGRYEEAERFYLQSLDIRRKTHGEESALYIKMLSSLGRLATLAGEYDTAERRLSRVQAWQDTNLAADDPARVRALERLGILRRAVGEPELSVQLLDDALDLAIEIYGPTHRAVGVLHVEKAWSLTESATPRRCEDSIGAARKILDHDESWILHRGRLELASGICAAGLGRIEEAESSLESALRLLRPALGDGNHWVREAVARLR